MSLVRKIQDSAIDPNIDISTLLRQTKVLAARLKNNELKKWVDSELNGYGENDILPDYRIIHTESKGHFSGYFQSGLRNGNIPIVCMPKKFREKLRMAYCAQPISTYEALIKSSKDEKNFHEEWPADLVALYGNKIYEDMNCLSAWKEIPYGAIFSLVDVVRTKILNFTLEMEAEFPSADNVPINDSLLTEQTKEKISHVFNMTINGNVGNIAEGSTNVSQTATINVISGDIKSLRNQLLEYGVQPNEVKELEEAIKNDNKAEIIKNKSLGKNVAEWLGTIVSKSVKFSTTLAKGVSIELITKAVLLYYGI